jgi:hypothetical protein
MDDQEKKEVDKTAAMDQARTFVVDHFPRLWRGLYTGLISEGFSEQQAFTILLTYVSTSCKAT